MDWLIGVEYVFEYKYTDPKCMQFIETKLRTGAMRWWRNIQTSKDSAGLPRITKWRDMLNELQKKVHTDYL